MHLGEFDRMLSSENRNKWFNLGNQNLSVFMREAGFDLAVFDGYSKNVQAEARHRAIRNARSALIDAFKTVSKQANLSEIKQGVYVIRLARGMVVNYHKQHSPIVYIGQGAVLNRIQQHYEGKLFEFMQSLGGVDFEFLIAEPWKPYYRKQDFHKQVEFSLIKQFGEIFGGLDGRSKFPLMNRIAGSDRGLDIDGDWWRKPLKRSGSRTNWVLQPGPHSGFVGALDPVAGGA